MESILLRVSVSSTDYMEGSVERLYIINDMRELQYTRKALLTAVAVYLSVPDS